MPSIEENKALLQRAMDEGLEVEYLGIAKWHRIYPVYVNEVQVVEDDPDSGISTYTLAGREYRIVEKTITGKDLAEAIGEIMLAQSNMKGNFYYNTERAISLAAKYLAQDLSGNKSQQEEV